jgi:competence protein ComEA
MFHRVALLVSLAVVSLAPSSTVAATVSETASGSVTVGGAKVDINRAGVKELMTLAGVGRGLAEKIVKYRDEHGVFKRPQDLRKVEGVGDALWEKNRARIVVK